MKRLGVVVVALVLLAGACGDDRSPADKALAAAEDGLGKVESGELSMTLLASPDADDGSDERGVGFQLEGPFAVGKDEGDLPVADLEYTRITGGEKRTTGFLSTGTQAFAKLDGTYYRLGADQVEELRVTDDADGGGLEGLSLEDWVEEPRVATGPRVDGVATRRITGAVDAVPAINDLLELAGGFGAGEDGPKRLDGDGADAVRRAVRSAKVDLLVGAEDDLLRRLALVIDLSIDEESAQVRRALEGLAGARLRFDLDVTRVNRPVTVEAPADARPAP